MTAREPGRESGHGEGGGVPMGKFIMSICRTAAD